MFFSRICALIFVCLVVASCKSAPQPPPPAASVESAGWYVASKEPLTFCPKGYKLPGVQFGRLDGEYVYLADRSSRFYVPVGKDAQFYRKQALVAREASLRDKGNFTGSVASKIAWVGNAISSAATYPIHMFGQKDR